MNEVAMAKTAVHGGNTMFEKAKEKKMARMYHTRNFGTGHVEADYYYLSRVGLRGRKRWLLLSALLLAYMIVIGHLLLTSLILGVLRFDISGPPYFKFNHDGSLEWPLGATISDVWLDSTLEAFDNQSLVITGQTSQQVLFQSGNQRFNPTGNSAVNSSQVSMSPSMTRVSPFKTFAITRSSHQLLSINSSLAIMDSVTSVRKLRTNTGLKTNAVVAPIEGGFTVSTDSGSLSMLGRNGVSFQGQHINITSEHNVELTAPRGSLFIGGIEGVTLHGLLHQSFNPNSNYHVCACAVSGQLFLVPSNPQRCVVSQQDIDAICGL